MALRQHNDCATLLGLSSEKAPKTLVHDLEVIGAARPAEQEHTFDPLQDLLDSLVAWFLDESRSNRATDGDDLALCIRVVRWISRHTGSRERLVTRPEGRLEPLLVQAASNVGAGVEGITEALRIISGTWQGDGLRKLRFRQAFAEAIREHLDRVPVDVAFRFGRREGGAGIAADGGGGGKIKARLALPATLDWGAFRGYTVTMWLRPDPTADGDSFLLFCFRNSAGVGVEAALGPTRAEEVEAGQGGTKEIGGRSEGEEWDLSFTREIKITSYHRSNLERGSSVKCRVGSLCGDVAENGAGGGTGAGARAGDRGGWRLVTVSHGLPYVRRSGRLQVAVDAKVVLEAELPYPTATGQASGDVMLRSSFFDGMVGCAGAVALYEEELGLSALQTLFGAGPNHLGGTQPLPVAQPNPNPDTDPDSSGFHTQVLSGEGAKAAAEARILWAYLPQMCQDKVCHQWTPRGSTRLHKVVISSPHGGASQRGQQGVVARLEGEADTVSLYSSPEGGRGVAPSLATQAGIHDAWFRAGGVRGLLYAMARVVDELAEGTDTNESNGQSRDSKEQLGLGLGGDHGGEDNPGVSLLGELVKIMAALLASGPVHREEFLKVHGFHMLSIVLQRLPNPKENLSGTVVAACLHLLDVVDALQELELIGAALQGLVLDFRLWSEAGGGTQEQLLVGVERVASKRAPQLRLFLGVQLLLDILRVHICMVDLAAVKPNPGEREGGGGKLHCSESSGDGRPHQREGTVALRTAWCEGRGQRQGQGEGGRRDEGSEATAIEGCVDSCTRMLLAMLMQGLSESCDVEGEGAGAWAGEGAGPRAEVGPGGPRGSTSSGSGAPGGGEGSFSGEGGEGNQGASSQPPEGGGGGGEVGAVVACLLECQSPVLQRGLVGVLLKLRVSHPRSLRRELLWCNFASEVAPALLTKKGYTSNVREGTLDLTLWLLQEAKLAGEERLLVLPPSKSPPLPMAASAATTAHASVRSPPGTPGSPGEKGTAASPSPGTGGGGGVRDHERRGRRSASPGGRDRDRDRDRPGAGSRHGTSSPASQAQAVALAVTRGVWGPLPSASQWAAPPVGESIVRVALRGGSVATGDGCNAPGGEGRDGGGGGGEDRASLWLSVPFVAALLPGASPDTRQEAVTSLNIVLKSDPAARKGLLQQCEHMWADCLMELALCDREWTWSHGAGAGAGAGGGVGGEGGGGSYAPSIKSNGMGGEWESIVGFGTGAISAPVTEIRSLCEELALASVGFLAAEAVSSRPRGWTIFRPVLAALGRAAWVCIGPDAGGRAWRCKALCKLSTTVLQHVSRGTGQWTELTLDGLNKVILLIEERLFPDEGQPCPWGASGPGAGARDGVGAGAGVVTSVSFSGLVSTCSQGGNTFGGRGGRGGGEGGDAMAATVNPLVDCLVEITRGLRCILSTKPLPAGDKVPAAAVAAAAVARPPTGGAGVGAGAGAGGGGVRVGDGGGDDDGLRGRARTALWPSLRVLGRIPALREVGADLSRVIYREVFSSLQTLLSLTEVDPTVGKDATLSAFLGLQRALSACDQDLSRTGPSATW
ncbi:unnamed protein product, partial [Discosporangium mesarthrocarpum]